MEDLLRWVQAEVARSNKKQAQLVYHIFPEDEGGRGLLACKDFKVPFTKFYFILFYSKLATHLFFFFNSFLFFILEGW